MDVFMKAALKEAEASFEEGGLPVGSVIVLDGEVLGAGRNRYAQTGDPITHAEIEAIRDAASRVPDAGAYGFLDGATCYTTMMPCEMCSGALIRFGVRRVVVAETESYVDAGTRPLMEKQGMTVEISHAAECVALVNRYYEKNPEAMAGLRSKDRRRLEL